MELEKFILSEETQTQKESCVLFHLQTFPLNLKYVQLTVSAFRHQTARKIIVRETLKGRGTVEHR